MKRSYILLSILGIAVVVLSVVQISISNILTTGGITLSRVNSQIQEYQKENAILKEQIYSVASLTYLGEEAEKNGYQPGVNSSTIVIANTAPLAIKP